MRRLILIALAVGLTAALAACGSNNENQLTDGGPLIYRNSAS